jgi:HSP20 family molecular chaperone IbpA
MEEEANMADGQALEVQDKKELVSKEEKTVPARYFVPATDIYENEEALTVVMEVPGVERKDVDINLENDVIRIEARIDTAKYNGLEPLYTEYNVGHFARTFSLSSKIDRGEIGAQLEDGVLTLTLPKAKEALPRRIQVG